MCHHGSEVGKTERTRSGARNVVDFPSVVKEYSFKKVGVDVGDQQLRNKVSYADNIKSMGWSRKWGMHGIQRMQKACLDPHGRTDRVERLRERSCGSSTSCAQF